MQVVCESREGVGLQGAVRSSFFALLSTAAVNLHSLVVLAESLAEGVPAVDGCGHKVKVVVLFRRGGGLQGLKAGGAYGAGGKSGVLVGVVQVPGSGMGVAPASGMEAVPASGMGAKAGILPDTGY